MLAFVGFMLPLLTFSLPHAQAGVLDRLEASVNGALVLRSDVARFRRTLTLRSQLDPLFANSPLARTGPSTSDADIVQFLIQEQLILQAHPVSDAEVEQEINSVQASNKIDRGSLRRALQEQGFSFIDYFELIRISVSKRNLIDRDIRVKVSVGEDDIRNEYYNSYGRTEADPSSFDLQAVILSLSAYRDASAAREVAERALSAIKGGESFDEVAKRFSSDASSENGGHLGFLHEDQLSPLIREETRKLRVGGVSGVFGGPKAGAFYIIKLNQVKTVSNDRYNRAKEEIRAKLTNEDYGRQISLWIERQEQSAHIRRAGDAAVK